MLNISKTTNLAEKPGIHFVYSMLNNTTHCHKPTVHSSVKFGMLSMSIFSNWHHLWWRTGLMGIFWKRTIKGTFQLCLAWFGKEVSENKFWYIVIWTWVKLGIIDIFANKSANQHKTDTLYNSSSHTCTCTYYISSLKKKRK